MKVIENKTKPIIPEWPKVVTCRHCGSRLEIELSDIKKGEAFYSQREIDYGVQGYDCPCCGEFNAI